MGTKRKRMESLLQQEISSIVQKDLSDPRIGFVTITHVELANDFKSAQVSFSAISGSGEDETEGRIRLYEEVLNHSAGTVQMIIAKSLKLRYTPKITFAYDDGLKKSMEISSLIREARSSDVDHIHPDDEPDPEPDSEH